jgi:photosystem I P700 chlorophyll a apoprotein A1
MEALGRHHDTFGDTAIQLRPACFDLCNGSLAVEVCQLTHMAVAGTFWQFSTFGQVYFSTADFLVFHVETFCIHTAVLILVKGFLVSRSSRLMADKNTLGFLYPCDGPGRGGTCQLAPWDHAFLGAFWAYNTGSVGTFHWFWYAQQVRHVVDDWTLSAPSINGWLRSFLWAESAQVIQAYATPCSWLSLAFLTGHFVWALSLMFLFSGRGYWQELVESLLWVHVKLQLVPSLQPRALSITIGRAVGVIHFLAGGIGVSWAFTVCRLLQQIAEMLKCAIEAVFMVPSVGLGWHQLGSHGTWHHMSVGEGTFFTATTAGHIVHVG